MIDSDAIQWASDMPTTNIPAHSSGVVVMRATE
jgi:hypothetical protein